MHGVKNIDLDFLASNYVLPGKDLFTHPHAEIVQYKELIKDFEGLEKQGLNYFK